MFIVTDIIFHSITENNLLQDDNNSKDDDDNESDSSDEEDDDDDDNYQDASVFCNTIRNMHLFFLYFYSFIYALT